MDWEYDPDDHPLPEPYPYVAEEKPLYPCNRNRALYVQPCDGCDCSPDLFTVSTFPGTQPPRLCGQLTIFDQPLPLERNAD